MKTSIVRIEKMIEKRDGLSRQIDDAVAREMISLLNSTLDSLKVVTNKGINPKPRKAKSNGHQKKSKANGQAAKRILQGRYMGYVRSLTATQKKEISGIREEKGYHAAIRAAKAMKNAHNN